MRTDREGYIRLDGRIVEVLGQGRFRIALEGEEDSEAELIAMLCGKMRQRRIRVVLGDEVEVDVSMYDPKKGRIMYRIRPGRR